MDEQLKKNTISLTLLQIGQYLVPLIILPYLARVLGVDGFGQIGFATAFTVYFILVVEWGFNLYSTREVSVTRFDRLARSAVFWETLLARAMLSAVVIFLLFTLISLVPRLFEVSTLLWLGVLQVLSASISTSFYYQGIEKMTAMAVINLGVRVISIPLIILFVKNEGQVLLAFGIQTGCFLLASLVNLLILLKSGDIAWLRPSLRNTWGMTVKSFPLFLSYAGSSLYTNSNTVILGFVSSQAAVGYFVAGFTLVKAVVGLTAPFAQAVFPRASQTLSPRSGHSEKFLIKIFRMQGFLGLALSIALIIFTPWGVAWLYGEAFHASTVVVGWLTPLPLVICLASVLGMQTLVPLGKNQWFSNVLLAGGLLNCLLLFTMGYLWGELGAAISVLITEFAILLAMAAGVKRFAPSIWHSLIRLT